MEALLLAKDLTILGPPKRLCPQINFPHFSINQFWLSAYELCLVTKTLVSGGGDQARKRATAAFSDALKGGHPGIIVQISVKANCGGGAPVRSCSQTLQPPRISHAERTTNPYLELVKPICPLRCGYLLDGWML